MTDTRTRLLDAAESSMRERGYHAVSFRDLAEMLDIKSASVHYHFRQKEDLGVALVERYQQRFFEALDQRAGQNGAAADNIAAFCATYRASLVNSQHLCLCAMLGAESKGLPSEVATVVNQFFASNIDWLQRQIDAPDTIARARAQTMLSTLQGAMMLASSIGDHTVFDSAIECMLADQGHKS
jgi:TetR/AcrR family transcriptional repressor of nem operon